jgi:hypothetical protein
VYKLQLPPEARIHPVIHVSQLKQAIKNTDVVSADLPVHSITDKYSVQPCAVIAERFVKQGSKMKPQVKLRWKGLPDSCSTWEHLYAVVAAFPEAPAWGQASSSQRGIVTAHHLPAALAVMRRAARRQEIREAHLAVQNEAQKTKTKTQAAMGVHDK